MQSASGAPAFHALAPAGLAFAAGALGVIGAGFVLGPLRPARRGVEAARLLRFLAAAGGRLRPASSPRELRARIAAAGAPAGLEARELMAAKLAAACGGGVAGALAGAVAPGRLGVALAFAAPAAGSGARSLARTPGPRARARARRELPVLLDLLRVVVAAGGSLAESLRTVGERAEGPLAAEWRAVGRQVALGVPRSRALADMLERLPIAELRLLVSALERTSRHGAPLTETLIAQARDARFGLARQAREEAGRAGPKIQLVVAMLLVPSVLLLVAAALVAALVDSGGMVVPL